MALNVVPITMWWWVCADSMVAGWCGAVALMTLSMNAPP